MKNGGWLSKYNDVPEAQNGIEGTMGGLTDKGFNYNGAWGGTMAMGGSLPGAVGFTYARTQSPAPSNGPYAKKTKASAQTGDLIIKTDTGGGGAPEEEYIKLDPTKFSQTTTTGVSEAFDPTNSKWKGQSTEWLQKRIQNAELLVQAIKDARSLPKDEWKEKYKGASFAAVGEGRAQPILPDFYNDYKKRDDAFIQDWSQARDQAKNELLMQSRWTANKDKAKKEALDFLGQYKNQNEFLSNFPTQASQKYGYTPGETLNPNEFLSKDVVSKAYYAINANKGFPLPQDPTNEMTCANGICTLESMIGVDFSPLKGKKGVYYDPKTGYTIPQYNPTFVEDNNYAKVGYRKLNNLNELPQPGDIVQYSNEGVPGHMELVLENLPNGIVVYNNYSQTNDNRPGEGKEIRGFRPGKYNQLATDNFDQTNYFRLTPEAQQKALSRNPTYLKKVEGKKAFESSEDYKKFMETQEYIKANQEKYNKFNQLNPQDWRNGGRTSAQNGMEMRFYQEGLDWKPKNISQNGGKTKKARQPKRVVVFAERPVIKSDPRAGNEFVTEAQNVVNFYKRVSPSTKVEILPVYETGDNKTKQKIQDTLSKLSPDDDVMVFGHHGTKYAGIPTEQWASLLEDSNYGNCYLGSCQSEDVASRPWRNVRNLTYRPYSLWQGFNPKSDSVIDAMFSRGASYPAYNMQPAPLPENFSTGEEYMKAWNSHNKLVNEYNARESERPHKPNENYGDYSVKPNTPKWKKVNPFGNTNELNPFEYYQRQTGLPMSLAPPAKSKKEDGGWLSKYEEGGVIEDDMGQWAHPGEITKINSNQITMQGVDYPVLGISDTGDTKMMKPGKDYKFKGKSVTEVPMMQKGGEVIKVKQPNGSSKTYNTNSEEYRKLYDSGNLMNYDKSTDTYFAKPLDEVVITGQAPEKGFWEQSIDSYLNKNKDAGFFGALGSVATYPLGLAQQAMMYNLTGKVQDPSEALNIENPYGAFAVNAIADPTNLFGIGLADDALRLSNRAGKFFTKGRGLTETPGNLAQQMKQMNQFFSEEQRFDRLKETTNPESLNMLSDFKKRISTPEGKRRMKELGITREDLLDALTIVEDPTSYGYYRPSKNKIAIHPDIPFPRIVGRHEVEHGVQRTFLQSLLDKGNQWYNFFSAPNRKVTTKIDDILSDLELWDKPDLKKVWDKDTDAPTPIDVSDYEYKILDRQNATDYFTTGSKGKEKSAFLSEAQQWMMDQGMIPKDDYVEVTPEMVKQAYDKAKFDKTGRYLRIFNIMRPTEKNYKKISKGLNKMLTVSPMALGAGAIGSQINQPSQQKNGGWLNKYK
jgi:hypothetical protein